MGEVDEEGAKAEEKKEEVKEESKEEAKEEAKEEVKEDKKEEEVKKEEKEEEKQKWFLQKATSDLTERELSLHFAKFSVPSKAEGFDEVVFDWQKEGKVQEYLKTWLQERKKTIRAEDLTPSPWFQEKLKAFQGTLKEYQDLAWKANKAKAAEPKKKRKKKRRRAKRRR